MNWLAHMHLARHSDAAMLGALLGDFAFGRQGLDRFGAVEHAEILLHRRIDRFTDSHPLLASLRSRFPEGRRRYAGIALDMHFDHLLARDWARWGDGELDDFTARAYKILRMRFDTLPPRLQAIVPSMVADDWLGGYRRRDSVDRAITRIATRLSRNGERLLACLDDLRREEAAIEAGFERFFPELTAFVDTERRGAAGG